MHRMPLAMNTYFREAGEGDGHLGLIMLFSLLHMFVPIVP